MNGRELRAWRKAQYLSQPELAAILDVHVNTVANWESSATRTPRMLELACEAITGQRARQVRLLRAVQEKLAHQRRLRAIAQGLPERRAAAAALRVTEDDTREAIASGEIQP